MARWFLGRAIQAAVTFAAVVTLLFFLMRLAPGDPLWRAQEGGMLTPEARAVLEELYGVNRPLLDQFATFVKGVARGNLGSSIGYGLPVTTLIAGRLPATLLLSGTVLLLNFTLGLWLGVRQAIRRGSAEDRVLTVLSLACYATPSFWLGLMLAWLFAVEWRLLPSGGVFDPLLDPAAGPVARAGDLLAHLVLPAVTLSAVTIAATMRYQRNAMIEVLRLPYIVTARAKGLTESRVTTRHAWRNALFPVITIFGLWLPILVTGSVFVEEVFAWPGLGSLAAASASARDYPLLMGTSLLAAGLVVTAGLLTDAAYAALDPRVRRS